MTQTVLTYDLELEADRDGWQLRWPQAQTDAYGIEATLNAGSGQPAQADYDHAMYCWVLAHLAGLLPPPLGKKSAQEALRDLLQERYTQNAPSTEMVQ